MKKGFKKVLKTGGLVCGILLAVLILAGLFFYFNKPLVKKISENYLTKKTGLSLEIGKIANDLALECGRFRPANDPMEDQQRGSDHHPTSQGQTSHTLHVMDLLFVRLYAAPVVNSVKWMLIMDDD